MGIRRATLSFSAAWITAFAIRSDYPNQINNVLCFPGLFRGVLDARAMRVTVGMKVAAAHALASVVKDEELGPEYIIPSVFNREVSERMAKAVIQAAEQHQH